MKFDKFMSFCYRFLCFSLACVLLVGSVVSCARPVRASASGADPVDVLGELRDFKDQYLENLSVVANALTTDITNGNLDATSQVGQQILQSYALQTAMGAWITGYYGQPDLEITWEQFDALPDTLPVTGSSGCGLYQISGFSDYRIATLHIYDGVSFSGVSIVPLVTSQDFELFFTFDNTENRTFSVTSSVTQPYFNFSTSYDWWAVHFCSTNSVGFQDLNQWTSAGRYLIPSSVPVLSSIPATDTQSNSAICGNLSVADLSEGSVDKETPWTYYNNSMLNSMTDIPDIYLVFPDGYSPDSGSESIPSQNITNYFVAPPIILGAGAIVAVDGVDFNVFVPVSANPQFTIDGINFQFPQIDNDLHRVWIDSVPYSFPTPEIDIKGHTVEVPDLLRIVVDGVVFYLTEDPTLLINDLIEMALPVGSPDMSPSEAYDYEYYFPTETLADIRLPDSTLPNSVALPSGVTSALPALWAYIYDFIDACGILSILPFLLTASVCAYVVHRLGS